MALIDTLKNIAGLTTQMAAIANSGASSGFPNDAMMDDLYRRLQQAMQQYVVERNMDRSRPPDAN
jgi:hypothetical protein